MLACLLLPPRALPLDVPLQVYVSIYSDDKGKRRAMDNLQRLEP